MKAIPKPPRPYRGFAVGELEIVKEKARSKFLFLIRFDLIRSHLIPKMQHSSETEECRRVPHNHRAGTRASAEMGWLPAYPEWLTNELAPSPTAAPTMRTFWRSIPAPGQPGLTAYLP